ncbi:hypothetical protein M406DRAFT_351686 [Cryphonectria parasitica EP155]|uniref:Uncharacterized protein n=1 Tax=Cryphonectria parasitica (strain ATCC 38755 / EP155) TaxID=660469 RepID=A0A9P4Y0X4_CRYP1|nr:uncharacterized protein M406DRAFT_351686 [Cryphonectria parasitica EP155]KAF3764350.1 hypothetical protein M406DRAFT_351686 [Cryphonectria parasitica EP155]
MAPLPFQSPLVYDPSWRAAPLNSGMHSEIQPSAQHHNLYESPFEKVQLGAGLSESAMNGLTRSLASIDAFLARHPSVLLLTRLACLLSFLILLSLSLWDLYARSSRRQSIRDEERVRLDRCYSEKGGDSDAEAEGRTVLVTRGLQPGSLYRVTDEPVFLVPEAANVQMAHDGSFLVMVED